ncbi:hypothetical protein ACOJBM_31965 [Rhizobium beringeri]
MRFRTCAPERDYAPPKGSTRQNARKPGRHAGCFASQRILLSLIDAGLSRERAYAMVQKAAARAVRSGHDVQGRGSPWSQN